MFALQHMQFWMDSFHIWHKWSLVWENVLCILILTLTYIFKVIQPWIVMKLLTHWGRVMHICVGNLTIIGLDNGLSPGRRQAIIWTSDGILWIRPLGTNFSKILIEFLTFWLKKMHLNVSSAKWRPFCLGLNVLKYGTSCFVCSTVCTVLDGFFP